MRSVCTVLALASLALAFAPAPADAAMKERDVKKLLEEYLKSETADNRREEILNTLKPEDPALSQRTLKSAMKDDAERPLALKAAVVLKVPGLFKSVKDFIDTEDEQAVIDLFLVTHDEDGVELLMERLVELDDQSASYLFTVEAFKKHRLSSAMLAPFRKMLKDDKRPDAILEILSFQFDEPGLEKETALKDWDKLAAARDRNFRVWPITGHDVLALEGWNRTGTRNYGANLLVPSDGHMDIKDLPDYMTKKAGMTIKLRTCVLDGSGGSYSLAFGSWNSTYTPVIKDNQWITKDVDGSVFTSVPLKLNEWQEHVWVIAPIKGGNLSVRMSIDGKELIGAGENTEGLFGLLVKGDGSNFLIGGYDAIPDDK